MNQRQKHFSASLIALGALLSMAPIQGAWAQTAPNLGTASNFAVLGGTNVTCTAPGSIIGDVGVSPGGVPPFTNTGCVITGATPPATNAAAAAARTAFLNAYNNSIPAIPCQHNLLSTISGPVTLTPGVYCTGAGLTGTGVLTLDAGGNANAVWIFKIGAALTGTNFSVVMAGGGQACNVYWVPGAGVTMTTSALSGNILAGNATSGSITMTGGTLAGRALASVAVTMTGANVIGCNMLPGPDGQPAVCKDNDRHHHGDDDDKDHGHDQDKDHGHDQDKDHGQDDHKDGSRDSSIFFGSGKK